MEMKEREDRVSGNERAQPLKQNTWIAQCVGQRQDHHRAGRTHLCQGKRLWEEVPRQAQGCLPALLEGGAEEARAAQEMKQIKTCRQSLSPGETMTCLKKEINTCSMASYEERWHLISPVESAFITSISGRG